MKRGANRDARYSLIWVVDVQGCKLQLMAVTVTEIQLKEAAS